MSSNPNFQRRSIRLQGFDYSSSGAYFITICTQQRECFLSKIVDQEAELSNGGKIVQEVWDKLPLHYTNIELDAFVVMPNHVHGVILLGDTVGAGLRPALAAEKRSSLSKIIGSFKSFSARGINEQRSTPGVPVWQRNYYEHIIRNETSLNAIRQYILSNPAQWAFDKDNPVKWGK